MKKFTLVCSFILICSIMYGQKMDGCGVVTLNSQKYQIQKCGDDTLLIWKTASNDTAVIKIRIVGKDTIEMKRSNRRYRVVNGKTRIEALPMRYTTVTKRDTITPSNYRIIGKDTFIIPAQYSTKTEQIVIKEDISPGTPVSILSLDTHMATQTIPTSYKATFVRTSETQPNSTEKSVKSQNIKSSVSNSPSTNSETKRPVKKTIKKPVKKN